MRVTATDGDDDVLQLLRTNAAANARAEAVTEAPDAATSSTCSAAGPVSVQSLIWGEPPCAARALGLAAAPDLLIATGCVYASDEGVWTALVHTLVQLSGPHTLVLLVHGNGAAPGAQHLRGRFYELARKHFECARVAPHHLHAQHQGCTVACLVRR